MITNLETEMAEQAKWHPQPRWQDAQVFELLLQNEFAEVQTLKQRRDAAIHAIVNFAAVEVPYYRELFKKLPLNPEAIYTAEALQQLPVLTRRDVQNNQQTLRAEQLPDGEYLGGVAKSSGTTGQPTMIQHTVNSGAMFGLLRQREMRWFRFDPMASMAWIRDSGQIPVLPGQQSVGVGAYYQAEGWPRVSPYFQTGRFFGLNVLTPNEEQVDWLQHIKPDYLLSYSSSLEQLAFALQGQHISSGMRGLHAISELLHNDMQQRIESIFQAPVVQNYGLNELGLVASKCPEGGLYHVHSEHCHVEVVDQDGFAVEPGSTGKLLITALTNTAMPLIRYDTDDLVQAMNGSCKCGRTLPVFGKVLGRYSDIASLPEGTLAHVAVIREALAEIPLPLICNLRCFQIHQFLEGRFQLRIQSNGKMPAEFMLFIQKKWFERVENKTGIALDICQLDLIPREASGKFNEFTSDFFVR